MSFSHDLARKHAADSHRPEPSSGGQTFRGCERKKRYATKAEAKRAADHASKRANAPMIYVYECPLCGGWHLTHRRPNA